MMKRLVVIIGFLVILGGLYVIGSTHYPHSVEAYNTSNLWALPVFKY